VLAAYGGRCAISHIPEPRLLDAAHIVMDADEELGQPIVSNDLPLTKLHHAAVDAHLIRIDPDFRIHVSDRLLENSWWPFPRTRVEGNRWPSDVMLAEAGLGVVRLGSMSSVRQREGEVIKRSQLPKVVDVPLSR
jgi:DNA-binding transcriptional LysR family regulator